MAKTKEQLDQIETAAWLARRAKAMDKLCKAMEKLAAKRAALDLVEQAIRDQYNEDMKEAERAGKRARWNAE